jgi:hypothetical protein
MIFTENFEIPHTFWALTCTPQKYFCTKMCFKVCKQILGKSPQNSLIVCIHVAMA